MSRNAPPPPQVDFAVVGGGILGLAVAREVLRRNPGASLAVLEAEDEMATHQTSHSSGVIHAGVYYEPGSLRAKLCVEGSALLTRYCEQRGVPWRQSGKLIVAAARTNSSGLTGSEGEPGQTEYPTWSGSDRAGSGRSSRMQRALPLSTPRITGSSISGE